MATRKSKDSLIKVTLNVIKDDWDFLKEVYAKTGASHAVRKVITAHCEKLRETIKARQSGPLEVELDS